MLVPPENRIAPWRGTFGHRVAACPEPWRRDVGIGGEWSRLTIARRATGRGRMRPGTGPPSQR